MASPPGFVPAWVSPHRLAAALRQVPDPRRAASVASLAAILALAVAAILANPRSVLASAEWGARQDPALLAALGLPDGRTPCQSTLQRLFRHRAGAALAARLAACFRPRAAPAPPLSAAPGVAIAGKAPRAAALCGRARPHRPRFECMLPRAGDRPRPRADRCRCRPGGGGVDRGPGAAGADRLARLGVHRRRLALPNRAVRARPGRGRELPAGGQRESGHPRR